MNIFTSIEGACGGVKSPDGAAITPQAPPPTAPTAPQASPIPTLIDPDAPPPSQEAPPPYSTLPSGDMGAVGWSGPMVGGPLAYTHGYNARGFKLAYMDFVPRLLKKKMMGSVYEDFSILVSRANQWIEEHDGISVMSCETITWSGRHHEDIYADKCYLVQGLKHLRGLRMWYLTEVVPSPHRQRPPQVIQCRTFLPKPQETFTALLRRVNEALGKGDRAGRVLCVETVPQYAPVSEYKPGAMNPDMTRWSGDTNLATVALCLRLYILVTGEAFTECIGYQDFNPEHNQRHADNRGFEVCSELMDKATRWVAKQQGVRFTNIQTLNVKYKKKIPYEERCVYTANDNTVYLSIVRVFYVMQTGRGGADSRMELPPCRLTYRTFSPIQTKLGTSFTAVEYEDARNLCDRVNQWLQITGAQLFSIETVPIRLSSGSLGAEATFFRKRDAERWLYHIRIYLNGEYVEPPGAVNLVVPSQSKIACSEPNLYYPH